MSMFGFGRGNKKQYQVIDEDYDEQSPAHYDTLRSLLPLSMPSSTVGAQATVTGQRLYVDGREGDPLIPNAHDVGYQAPPSQHLASSAPEGLNDLETGGAGNGIGSADRGLMSRSSGRSQDQRWDHIQNLDEFFTRIYEYHQEGGFMCIAVKRAFNLVQFIFIVFLSTFFLQCIDYDVLFANSNLTTSGELVIGKRHFGDAIVQNCASHLHPAVVITILVAIVFWVSRCVKAAHVMLQMHEIQLFYNSALGIDDAELPNLTWHAVVKRICEVQPRLHLMIHTEQLSAVDLYNRILRFKNYFVAMVNQKILPPIISVPFLGDVTYLPNGLKSNIKRILFYSSSAAWTGPYLKEEFKNEDMLDELARQLEKSVTLYGLFNLVLFPFIFLYQILVAFFTISEQIRRRSDALGMRRYSNYGRYEVRHFNELDHELNARLNRSHLFANAYMDQFYSPLLEIIAKQAVFVAAAILGILVVLSSWDEDVLQIEHVITVMSVSGVVILVCRGLIPDENLVWQPEVLLSHVASELHYIPSEWKGKAHTELVRHEFEQYFQLKWMFIMEELSSPLLTPFILLFWLRPRCHQVVRFLHENTVSVTGLGDICSFAMLDVARHGDPQWYQVEKNKEVAAEADKERRESNGAIVGGETNAPHTFMAGQTDEARARDGKTELSVLHFAALNPEWVPPPASAHFIKRFKHRLEYEASMIGNPLSLPDRKNLLLESVHSLVPTASKAAPGRNPIIANCLNRIDGPLESNNTTNVLATIQKNNPIVAESLTQSLHQSGLETDSAAADMRVQALFLRNLHEESLRMSCTVGMGSIMRDYGGAGGHDMRSVFGVPNVQQATDSLIDVDASSYGVGTNTQSMIGGGRRQIGRQQADIPTHDERDEEENEEENEDDQKPPVNFGTA